MNIKKIIVVFIFIINSFAHSQNVEVTITNVKVNNVSIPTGSEINFNNNSTVQLNFRVELEKLASFSIGNCKLRIRTYRSSGSYIEHFQGNVSPSNFVESTFGDYQYTLYASDYDAGIGNYLPRYAKSPDFEFYIPKKVPRLFGTFCFYKLTLRKVS